MNVCNRILAFFFFSLLTVPRLRAEVPPAIPGAPGSGYGTGNPYSPQVLPPGSMVPSPVPTNTPVGSPNINQYGPQIGSTPGLVGQRVTTIPGGHPPVNNPGIQPVPPGIGTHGGYYPPSGLVGQRITTYGPVGNGGGYRPPGLPPAAPVRPPARPSGIAARPPVGAPGVGRPPGIARGPLPLPGRRPCGVPYRAAYVRPCGGFVGGGFGRGRGFVAARSGAPCGFHRAFRRC